MKNLPDRADRSKKYVYARDKIVTIYSIANDAADVRGKKSIDENLCA